MILLLWVSSAVGAQDNFTLQPGVPLKKELAGGGLHNYAISLAEGQYARIRVEQYGINVVLTVFDPHNTPIIEMNSPSGAHGPEYASVMAASTGDYRLQVRATEKWANAGWYEVVVEELRSSVPADLQRLAAEKAFADGRRLLAQETKESRQAAITKFQQSRAYWEGLADRHWQAITLYSECAAQRSLGDSAGAVKCFDNALTIPLDEHDWRLKATILNDKGIALSALNRAPEALPLLTEALGMFQQKQDRRGQASALNNIGVAHARAGRMREAIKYYEQAVPLRRAENDLDGETNVLNNIGGFYEFLGEPRQALDNYNKALQNWLALAQRGELRDQDKLGTSYNNVAFAYDWLGEWQLALASYAKALEVFERTGNDRVKADTLGNLGELYMVLGDYPRALKCLEDARQLLRAKVKGPESMANVLTHLGQLHLAQNKPTEALQYFEEALSLRQTPGGRAAALTAIGSVQALQGNVQQALTTYGQALAQRRESKEPRGLALTLHKRGEAYAAGGEHSKAVTDFDEALRLWRTVADQRGEASSLLGLARAERNRGNLDGALKWGSEALSIIESLRTKVASQRLRTAYFSTRQDYYEVYIDVRMRLYERDKSPEHVIAAFQASERARARSLIDTLREADVDIREGVGEDLLRRERDIQQRLNAKARAKMEFKYTPEQAASIDKEIEALVAAYDDVMTQIRVNSPNLAHLLQPQVSSLPDIQQRLLDDGTLLLEFFLGETQSYLWAVTTTSIDGYTLLKRDEVEAAARRLYNLITAPQPAADGSAVERRRRIDKTEVEYSAQALALSQTLLGKVAGQLGKRRLLIVGDGVLQYFPFSALPAPGAARPTAGPRAARLRTPYLIEEHEIVGLPSASVLAVLRGLKGADARAPVTVVVIADPVFDKRDERLGRAKRAQPPAPAQAPNKGSSPATLPSGILLRSEMNLQPLPLTSDEAAAISQVARPERTEVALGFEASKATLLSMRPGQYRIIHFATHGLLNSEQPELSGLVLSLVNEKGEPQDGVLRLQDIYNLKLPADLVVLSACSTGLGSIVKGEGLIGLTRGFMYAGSPRVVASLWRVDDFATVRLMQRFYQALLEDGLPPPAALRKAQIEMLRNSRWRLPYFWSAFLIQGEWRDIGPGPGRP